MKEKEIKFISLNQQETISINGGDCACPECIGGWVGRTVGYFIRFWATADYGRVPLA